MNIGLVLLTSLLSAMACILPQPAWNIEQGGSKNSTLYQVLNIKSLQWSNVKSMTSAFATQEGASCPILCPCHIGETVFDFVASVQITTNVVKLIGPHLTVYM